MPYKTLNYQSSLISYQLIGSGKPILLIHGFGEDGTVWQNQINFLKDNYQLIVPDLPGSGKSQMIDDMSIEGMGECIKTIIDFEFSAAPPSVVNLEAAFGHSMGGYITLALVQKYPSIFSSFGLVHSTAFADDEEKKMARKKSIAFIEQNGAYEFLKTTIPNLFLKGQNDTMPPQSYMNDLIEEGRDFTPNALIAYYNAMINRQDRTNILKTFTNPILFIIGEHDKAIPFAQSLQQCHLPQQPHIHILRNSAHMGMWEESLLVNSKINSFLNYL